MHDIKAQIEVLKATEPPKDYTVEQIKAWLESLKKQPDRDAVRLLIERIDVISDGEDVYKRQLFACFMFRTFRAILRTIGARHKRLSTGSAFLHILIGSKFRF